MDTNEVTSRVSKRLSIPAMGMASRKVWLSPSMSDRGEFGGDAVLGHADLPMLQKYLALQEQDATTAHRRHGPVDHLGL